MTQRLIVDPPGRPAHEHNDCTVLTLSKAFNCSYLIAHAACKKFGRKDQDGLEGGRFVKAMKHLARKRGLSCRWFKSRRRDTLSKFWNNNREGTFIVCLITHVCCIKNGWLHYTFIEDYKRKCVRGVYRVKPLKTWARYKGSNQR